MSTPRAESPIVELTPERPVAGGRMIARHDGRVVLVAGAIPGERVRARIERSSKGVTWARVIEIVEASPDRRSTDADPACGGLDYAHIAYPRQLALKGEVVADAFRRIAKHPLQAPPVVAASPETGYRLRARLHVVNRRAGFFREGTHSLCDAAPSGQLRAGTLAVVQAVLDWLGPRADACEAVTVAETLGGDQCLLHLDAREGASLRDLAGEGLGPVTGLTGLTALAGTRLVTIHGRDTITDPFPGGGAAGTLSRVSWTRHAPSFFQSNRYLAGALLERVLALAEGRRVLDLYSGVGFFALPLAARGAEVVAVEGDVWSGADLDANAGPWRATLDVVRSSVEEALADAPAEPPDVVVLDPPRTGLSPAALEGVATLEAPAIVYVSCDPPTLARDAGQLLARGYRLTAIEAFDFFPSTPHVELLAKFQAG